MWLVKTRSRLPLLLAAPGFYLRRALSYRATLWAQIMSRFAQGEWDRGGGLRGFTLRKPIGRAVKSVPGRWVIILPEALLVLATIGCSMVAMTEGGLWMAAALGLAGTLLLVSLRGDAA